MLKLAENRFLHQFLNTLPKLYRLYRMSADAHLHVKFEPLFHTRLEVSVCNFLRTVEKQDEQVWIRYI